MKRMGPKTCGAVSRDHRNRRITVADTDFGEGFWQPGGTILRGRRTKRRVDWVLLITSNQGEESREDAVIGNGQRKEKTNARAPSVG